MDQDFKDIYDRRKQERGQARREALEETIDSIKGAFRGKSDDDYSSKDAPIQRRELTPEEKRQNAQYGASYAHFLKHMYHPLAQDYSNFYSSSRALFAPKHRGHSDNKFDHKQYDNDQKNKLHYYFFELGASKAVSIAYNPDAQSYEYHKLNRHVDYYDITKTVKCGSAEFPRTKDKLVKVEKEVTYEPKEVLEFDDLNALRIEFKTDIADALLRSPGETAHHTPRSAWAGLRDFGLKKIFAFVVITSLANAYFSEKQPATNILENPATQNEVTIGFE